LRFTILQTHTERPQHCVHSSHIRSLNLTMLCYQNDTYIGHCPPSRFCYKYTTSRRLVQSPISRWKQKPTQFGPIRRG